MPDWWRRLVPVWCRPSTPRWQPQLRLLLRLTKGRRRGVGAEVSESGVYLNKPAVAELLDASDLEELGVIDPQRLGQLPGCVATDHRAFLRSTSVAVSARIDPRSRA